MIKATKREPGIGRGEPPLHGSPDFTTGFCPCVSLSAYALSIRQTPIQTLASQDGELDLCHVQPTAMLRRSVNRQLPCQPSGFLWWKSLVQHSWGMGVLHLQETFSDVVKTDKTGLSKTAHTCWMISAFANFLPGSTIFRLA